MKEVESIWMGVLDWKGIKELFIKALQDCKSQRDMEVFIDAVHFMVSSSEDEAQAKRRRLGLPET